MSFAVVQPLGWVDLSKRYQASGESIYRKLSGLLHGRVWSVIPAFIPAWDEHGHAVAWRGYPPSLHKALAEPVIQAADSATRTVSSYFGVERPPQDPTAPGIRRRPGGPKGGGTSILPTRATTTRANHVQ